MEESDATGEYRCDVGVVIEVTIVECEKSSRHNENACSLWVQRIERHSGKEYPKKRKAGTGLSVFVWRIGAHRIHNSPCIATHLTWLTFLNVLQKVGVTLASGPYLLLEVML